MSGTNSLDAVGIDGSDDAHTAAVRLPADGAYASVLRTFSAGLAARLDFTMDDVEDLRVVISEATALVLDQAVDGGDLTCTFDLSPGRLSLVVATDVDAPGDADYENFGWQVLAVLAEDAAIESAPGRYAVRATLLSSLNTEV